MYSSDVNDSLSFSSNSRRSFIIPSCVSSRHKSSNQPVSRSVRDALPPPLCFARSRPSASRESFHFLFPFPSGISSITARTCMNPHPFSSGITRRSPVAFIPRSLVRPSVRPSRRLYSTRSLRSLKTPRRPSSSVVSRRARALSLRRRRRRRVTLDCAFFYEREQNKHTHVHSPRLASSRSARTHDGTTRTEPNRTEQRLLFCGVVRPSIHPSVRPSGTDPGWNSNSKTKNLIFGLGRCPHFSQI